MLLVLENALKIVKNILKMFLRVAKIGNVFSAIKGYEVVVYC